MTRSPVAIWVFDFDGTLSEIVADREAAVLHPDCRELLVELTADDTNTVAIISSRSLEDLRRRVPLPRIILGGSSGLEWRMPDGTVLSPPAAMGERLEQSRNRLARALKPLQRVPGLEIEDKKWSLAIHFRHVDPSAHEEIFAILERVATTPGIKMHRGPRVVEVQALLGMDKSTGLQRLIRATRGTSAGARIVYAGDDENDATAIRWTLSQGGMGFIVGDSIQVSGATRVPDPPSLAAAIRSVLLEKASVR
ncbi:MAG: trehalose-phosphatase [Candidatus Zixiibacteriota bacterium]